MQPYRNAKPHGGTDCQACAPTGHGHHLCQADGCDEIATHQITRHATDLEFAGIPPTLAPIDGVATLAVFGCDDCAEDAFEPFCEHLPPEPVACPKCSANGDEPCTKPDRVTPRRKGWHQARHDVQPQPEPCDHAHQPDCDPFTDCQCSHDTPAPVRPRRPSGAQHWPEMTGLRIPIPAAQMLLAQTGIAWHQVAALRSKITQLSGQDAIDVDVYQTDAAGDRIHDDHGHPVTETVEILLPIAAGGTQ